MNFALLVKACSDTELFLISNLILQEIKDRTRENHSAFPACTQEELDLSIPAMKAIKGYHDRVGRDFGMSIVQSKTLVEARRNQQQMQ